jgi:hypothetical protein
MALPEKYSVNHNIIHMESLMSLAMARIGMPPTIMSSMHPNTVLELHINKTPPHRP